VNAMELITLSSDELSTLRKLDLFFDPNTQKLYEFRNRDGKALLLREIGQQKISKLLKNSLKNVLKVSELQEYQLISIQDDSVTLFNSVSGETFDLGFGDLKKEDIEEIKSEFFKGTEIIVQVFEYEDIKILIKFSKSTPQQESIEKQVSGEKSSEKELDLVKEIEKRKEKKRPFEEYQPKTKESKARKGSAKKPAKKKTTKSTKKPVKKKTTKSTKKPAKKTSSKKTKTKK
jgi:hypothetical protein